MLESKNLLHLLLNKMAHEERKYANPEQEAEVTELSAAMRQLAKINDLDGYFSLKEALACIYKHNARTLNLAAGLLMETADYYYC